MRLSPRLTLALLLLAACDDPAETAREVVDARGNCSEDSLRVSSETCVRMFERYAEMVTGGIHTYIGGMKAMDRAIQRLPPANFDTAGLGRAITLPRDGLAPDSLPLRFPPTSRAPRGYVERYEEFGPADQYGPVEEYGPAEGYSPEGYDRNPRSPVYERPFEREQAAPAAPPAPRRGVLLPPGSRLNRPWLGEEAPEEEYRDRIVRECDDPRARGCEEREYDRE